LKTFREKLHIYLPDCKEEIDAYDDHRLKEMVKMTLERMKLYEELSAFRFLFKDPDFKSEESQKTREKVFKDAARSGKILRDVLEILKAIPEKNFQIETISKEIATYHHKVGKELKNEDLYHLLRFVLTGSKSGATATKIMEIIGKEATIRRLSVWIV
jgi:glutamyl/glutaminyl-tRNA synthetase